MNNRNWIARFLRACLLACIILLGAAERVVAEREGAGWPHWRGPNANGVVDAGKPPLKWQGSENVAWVTPLKGTGGATPIVVGNRMYVVSAERTDRVVTPEIPKHPDARTEPPQRFYRFWLTALNPLSGKTEWSKMIVEAAPHEGHHRTNTYAGGSPVTDGQRLFLSLGSRGLFAFDLEGNELWKKSLGRMRTRRGWGEASPVAVKGQYLIVPWDQEDQSRLLCLDSDSGEVKWEVLRDEPSNWSTPVFLSEDSGPQVIVNGTNRARGYDLQTGKSLWEVGSLSVNAIPSPVYDDQFIYLMSGYQKSVVYAVPRGASGDLTGGDELGWTLRKHTPYVASPLLYDGLIYLTKGLSNRISIVEAATGKFLVEAEPLTGLSNVYASPVGANGYVYIVDREGKTAVLKAGRNLELVAVNRINDTVDASPVVLGDRLYLRAWSAVYCLREQ